MLPLLVLLFVYSSATGSSDFIENFPRTIKECKGTNNYSLLTVDDISKNCLFFCAFQKLNVMTASGKIIEETVSSSRHVDFSKKQHCLNLQEPDLCKRAMMFFVCITSGEKLGLSYPPCNEADKTLEFRTFDDVTKSCRFFCHLKKLGYMNEEGEFMVEKLKAGKSQAQYDKFKHCLDVKETDTCRKAMAFDICVFFGAHLYVK